MFKKLLSNLPFNPSLIGQVSFYSKRVHNETRIRRIGLIMVVLAMVVQMLAIVSPPESSLALSNNDIIPGGIRSVDDAYQKCLSNQYKFASILESYGITCDNIRAGSQRSLRSNEYGRDLDSSLYSMGRLPYGKTGELAYPIEDTGTFYFRPLWAWDSGAYSTYTALEGHNVFGVKFFILFNCGNLVVIGRPELPEPTPQPEPTPEPEPTLTPGNAVCTGLAALDTGLRTYKFTAGTAGTDYVVKSYTFDFGDNTKKVINSGLYRVSTSHTYTRDATYKATASIAVNVQGASGVTQKTLTCSTTVTPEILPTATPPEPEDVCEDIDGTQTSIEECKPCDKSANSDDTTACLVLSKVATNETQDIENANGTVAHAGDEITYTLSAKNTGGATIRNFVIEENIGDVLDYATVVNLHEGELGEDSIVRWPGKDIEPGKTITQTISVKIKDPIPQTPISTSNPGTYDLRMTNVYGNTVEVELPPSVTKTTEQVVRQLPNTGPGETMAAAVTFTIFASYFLARSRLFGKELDIVRTDYAASGGY